MFTSKLKKQVDSYVDCQVENGIGEEVSQLVLPQGHSGSVKNKVELLHRALQNFFDYDHSEAINYSIEEKEIFSSSDVTRKEDLKKDYQRSSLVSEVKPQQSASARKENRNLPAMRD